MNGFLRVAVLAVIAVVAIVFYAATFVVQQTQSAIVLRFGAVRSVVTEPGLYFKLPAPFEQVTYLDKIEGRHTLRMHSQVGKTSPAYCTGVGKAALSLLPADALAHLAAGLEFQRFTENTIATPEALIRDVSAIRVQGYGFDLQEHEIGIHCAAAPVHAPGRNFHAAISVTGPAYRVDVEQLYKWAPLVRETADKISAELACRLSPVADG